jgi:endonuclease-8
MLFFEIYIMPEGPSVVILKEEAAPFAGKAVLIVTGNSKIDQERLQGKEVLAFKSWGKHFLICFSDFAVRIHFLMWGSYKINERNDRPVRLGITFENGEINFYSCSVKILEGDPDSIYDYSSDVMSESWDPDKAIQKISELPGEMACDILLDQDIFSGVGNIIKNEVLYRIKVHPESLVGKMPDEIITEMATEARNYSFDFYEWKKKFELKKHWLVHTKKICPGCNLPLIRKHTGKRDRRSFFCSNCQKHY